MPDPQSYMSTVLSTAGKPKVPAPKTLTEILSGLSPSANAATVPPVAPPPESTYKARMAGAWKRENTLPPLTNLSQARLASAQDQAAMMMVSKAMQAVDQMYDRIGQKTILISDPAYHQAVMGQLVRSGMDPAQVDNALRWYTRMNPSASPPTVAVEGEVRAE